MPVLLSDVSAKLNGEPPSFQESMLRTGKRSVSLSSKRQQITAVEQYGTSVLLN